MGRDVRGKDHNPVPPGPDAGTFTMLMPGEAVHLFAGRIEIAMRRAAARRVDDALAAARDAAHRAYDAALRDICGVAFTCRIVDVMSDAERQLRALAEPAAYEQEAARYLKQLQRDHDDDVRRVQPAAGPGVHPAQEPDG